MADYFDFIKKPVNNATPNQDGNNKSQITNNQISNDKTVNPPLPVKEPVKPSVPTPNQATNNLDLMTHLTQRSNRVMMAAQTKAKELKADLVDSEHLLYGLTTDSEIYNLLIEAKIQPP